MSKYLLPCECGKKTGVDVSQAGQQLSCECGEKLEVPTLRGVRELELAEETTSTTPKRAEWDAQRGIAFAGSLILIVIGSATSYFGYVGLKATPNVTKEAELKSFDVAVDDMSLEETFEAWQFVRDHGLGPRGQNVYVNIRSFRATRQQVLYIGSGLAIAGMIGAIAATLLPRKTSV